MSNRPTDDEIIDAMRERRINWTYVLKNIFRTRYPTANTAFFLRRMRALEKEGRVVEAIEYPRGGMLSWRLPEMK